jgi:hypothetical protein
MRGCHLRGGIMAKAPESSGAFFLQVTPKQEKTILRPAFVPMQGCHFRGGIRAKAPESSGAFFHTSHIHIIRGFSKTGVRPHAGMPFPWGHQGKSS